MTRKSGFLIRVVEDHKAPYPDPIQAKAGDDVTVDPNKKADIAGWVWCTNSGGKSGWVPKTYVEVDGGQGRMLRDYNAIELTIRVGDVLRAHATESGFHWVSDRNGRQGWVPVAKVQQIKG